MNENAMIEFRNVTFSYHSDESTEEKTILHALDFSVQPGEFVAILGRNGSGKSTIAKLANGITDTAVTMAAKAHLRNGRPVVLCPATNDGLAASAKNIGLLLDKKNLYFVPFRQDDPVKKPTSLVADFSKVEDAVDAALAGKQLQPVLLGPTV